VILPRLLPPTAARVPWTRAPFGFLRFQGWFNGIDRRALKLSDSSIAGSEEVCVLKKRPTQQGQVVSLTNKFRSGYEAFLLLFTVHAMPMLISLTIHRQQ